jgi:hypothetical protein
MAEGDLYVVPADVAALVPAVLDRELFNVSGLVRQNYDDRHSSALPLIIRHDPNDKQDNHAGDELGALAGGGAKVKRRLATLAAVAVRSQRRPRTGCCQPCTSPVPRRWPPGPPGRRPPGLPPGSAG